MLIRGRTFGQIALAVVYLVLALNAWAQVVLTLAGRSGDPPLLTVLQVFIGIAGTAAAWGAWVASGWSPGAAIAHGIFTAGMLVSLDPLLDLGADARSGLWAAAAVVLFIDSLFALYLYRVVRRDGTI